MGEKKIDLVLDGIEWSINHFAGRSIRDKVFEGRTLEEVSALSPREKAMWVKGAMERFDALVHRRTRNRIMEYCGGMCAGAAIPPARIEEAKERRKKHESLEDFLKAEGLVKEGDVLYVTYKFEEGKRCHCVGNGLPTEETMSRTYCLCGAGHVRAYWARVLERPVKVELLHSAVSGDRECKFAMRLVEKAPESKFKCKMCGYAFDTAEEFEKHEALARAQYGE